MASWSSFSVGCREPSPACGTTNQRTIKQLVYKRSYRESTSAPWTTAANLRQITEQRERSLVAQRHKDDAMVRQRGHGSNGRGLLPTTHRSGGDEYTSVLPPIATLLPDASRLVPERLPLSREVAVAGWDAEKEGIVLLKLVWVAENGDALVFRRSVHFLQYVFGESLFDLVEVSLAASFFNAFGFRLGEGLDVAPCGVLKCWLVVDMIVRVSGKMQSCIELLSNGLDLRRRWRFSVPLCMDSDRESVQIDQRMQKVGTTTNFYCGRGFLLTRYYMYNSITTFQINKVSTTVFRI